MHKQLATLLLAAVALASCGVDGKHFKLEGRILNMNQGEFYIYDDEGLIDGIDTIKVVGGRFAYEMPCERPTTAMLVFPNFSEQPIFVEPGEEADVKGDASNLRMLRVTGSKDNERMTGFREQVAQAAPPEMRRYARQFVEDHPESPVGVYLTKKYFVATAEPDLKEASRLVALMAAEQKDNSRLVRLKASLAGAGRAMVGSRLPAFTAHDTRGRLVSSADLSSGTVLISTFATWNYESLDQQRAIQRLRRALGGRFRAVSFSVDAGSRESLRQLERDSIAWPVVCDGTMLDNKVLRLLGLSAVPDNLLLKNGRVVARGIPPRDLQSTVEANL